MTAKTNTAAKELFLSLQELVDKDIDLWEWDLCLENIVGIDYFVVDYDFKTIRFYY